MKVSDILKKYVLPNLPYLMFLWVSAKLGETVRLAPGADASMKMLGLSEGFSLAFGHFLPTAGIDLLIGLCGMAAVRLAVYIKGKDAKKYRKNVEYGSARWGTKTDIAPFMDPKPENNIILTQSEGLMMSGRPKNPANARNKNVLVVGGSGSGKTRFFIKPNLMQMHSSYVVTDPKGTVLVECGKLLQRGAPKLDKDGKPVRDKRGKIVYEPYKIRVFNTINFSKSMHFNPFAYIHDEKDILKIVTTLIANTKGEGKAGDDFWVKAETLLYTALIGYIYYEAPTNEQNFATLVEMLNAMEVREDDESFKNAVDLLFDALEQKDPDHFALRQYKKYKLAAGVVCSKRLLNQAVGKSLRTHNLKPKKGAQVMRKNEKITALYERLSRDDFGKDDDQQRESNSISNQKAMLEEFAARQGFTNIRLSKMCTAGVLPPSATFLKSVNIWDTPSISRPESTSRTRKAIMSRRTNGQFSRIPMKLSLTSRPLTLCRKSVGMSDATRTAGAKQLPSQACFIVPIAAARWSFTKQSSTYACLIRTTRPWRATA